MSVTSAPNAANGSPGENRDRVDEALVQHAEDHVDHEDRQHEQERESLLRREKRLRRAGKTPGDGGSSISVAPRVTSSTAVPSDAAGARSKEMVTEGSCPEWLTVTGPTPSLNFATALSGTTFPCVERTQSLPSDSTSCWNSGSSSMTTQYSFVEV